MDNNELRGLIVSVLPYPDQIHDWDMTLESQVRFTWRGTRFRVSKGLMVEESENGMLSGSNLAIVLGALLKTAPWTMAMYCTTVPRSDEPLVIQCRPCSEASDE